MASHFGAAIATAGPTMAVLEPSTPSLLIWDVAGDEPIEISRFGRYGSKPGLLIRPEGIALDPEARRAYVADPGQMTISVFDVTRPAEKELNYLPELVHFVKALDLRSIDDPTHPIWPIEPAAIKFGPKKELWVLDAANNRVVTFDERLSFLRALGEVRPDAPGYSDTRLISPTDLALSPTGDTVYVVDATRAGVQAYDLAGKRLRTIGRRGTEATDLVRPFGIAVDAAGDLYVTDECADKVVRFDASGAPKQTFGKRGLGRVEFFKPKGITFDAKGDLIVLDWGNHRGQVLTRDGEFKRAFGSRVFVVPTLKKP